MRKLAFALVFLLALATSALAVLPQQFSTTRMTDATVARDIDDKHGEGEQAIAEILGFPVDTNINQAAFVGDANGVRQIVPVGYTQAALALLSCDSTNKGAVTTVTDGDAPGSLVQCDGVDSWRAPAEIAYQLINPALPPYNCDKDDTGTVNDACMVVLEDRLTSDILSPDELRPTVRWTAKYTITTAVTFAYGSNTTALLDWEGSAAIGGGLTCDFATTLTGCLTFTTTGSTLNGFSFENFMIDGGTTNAPDVLMDFPDGAAQVTWTGGGLSDFHFAGWRGKCVNCQFTGITLAMHNFTPDGAGVGESWFFSMNQVRKVAFDNISVEVTDGDLNLGIFSMITQPGHLVISNVMCVGDGVRLAKFLHLRGSAGVDPQEITIANNTCQQLRTYALDIQATSGQNVLKLRIIGNDFSRSTGAGGTAGIYLQRVLGAIIANNEISEFAICIDGDNVNESIITGNRLDGCASGIVLDVNYANNKVEGNMLVNITTTGIDLATTSTGENLVKGNDFVGTIPTTPYGLPGVDTADIVEFGDMAHTLTCADDAAGTVVTKTDVPFQANAYVDNDDTSGGCQWDIGDGTFPGQKMTSRFHSTVSAQPIKVSGDGGTNCVTLASSGIDRRAEWEWDGVDWILIDGPASAGC